MPPSYDQKKKDAARAAAQAKVENSAAAQDAKKKLVDAFSIFDINGDGVVDEEELIRILTRPQSTAMSREDAKDLITHFKAFDKNGDGVLNIDEFATALASVKNIQQTRQIMKSKTDESAQQFKKRMDEGAKKYQGE